MAVVPADTNSILLLSSLTLAIASSLLAYVYVRLDVMSSSLLFFAVTEGIATSAPTFPSTLVEDKVSVGTGRVV